MNESTRVVDAQLQHLLEVVERHREERCEALLEEAQLQARQLLGQAWREGRARLHQAVLDNREQARRQLASARAQHETQQRAAQHRQDRALIERAWQPLRDSLQQRWQQADSRRAWIDELVQQASTTLIDRHWRIEHPGDWPQAERSALQARLREQLGTEPLLQTHSDIAAGLRICAGDACVDGTPSGLLRARRRIEAMMLAALNACRDATPAGNRTRR